MDNKQNQLNRDHEIINNLEQRIKNNQFKSKDELFEEMVMLRNRGMGASLDNKKMRELLNLFDSMKATEEMPLDMQNYTSVGLENKDLIVSKTDGRILTTLEGTSAFSNEFMQKQNEILANSKDGMVNADAAFESMANHQKEESSLIPLTEAPLRDNIDLDILRKISFFMSNSYLDPNVFKIDIENGIFYNIETSEVYEVRENKDTNKYEIYKGNERFYGSNSISNNEPSLEGEKNQEEMSYEERLNKPKVRIRKKEDSPYMGFTKLSFLIINVITFGLLITMAILLYK